MRVFKIAVRHFKMTELSVDLNDSLSDEENDQNPELNTSGNIIQKVNFKPAKKRNSVNYQTKLDILKYCEANPNHPQTFVAKQFGVDRNVVVRVLKNKESLYSQQSCEPSIKRFKSAYFPELENALIIWIKQVRSLNTPIDGPTLIQKAQEFAAKLKLGPAFAASPGWLAKFKRRHAISFKSVQGEAGAVNPEQTKDWIEHQLPQLLQTYNPKDIFNLDECGLFFAALPDKTLCFKNETCTGGKHSKLRLTVLVGSNMNGAEKLKLLVIGKHKNPRCFKNIKSLPVHYEANLKSWMTAQIFENYIRKLDAKFAKENRRVLFILDNCSAHPNLPNLLAIKLQFLPPNTTAVSQPMEQGIIQNLKVKYRKFLLESRLHSIDFQTTFNISVLDSIFMINRAWSSVTSETISNCFRKAGFVPVNQPQIPDFEEEIEPVFSEAHLRTLVSSSVSLTDYMNVDRDLCVCGERTDKEILALATSATEPDISSDSDCEHFY